MAPANTKSFFTKSGDTRLHGITYYPEDKPVGRLFFLHGYGEHAIRYHETFEALVARGWLIHTFDQRGHGQSGGRRGYVSEWSCFLDDLKSFLGMIATEEEIPTFAMGHSHGCLILLEALLQGQWPPLDGMVLLSPFFRPGHEVARWKLVVGRLLNHTLPWITIDSSMDGTWMTSDPVMIEESRNDERLFFGATPRWFFSTRKIQDEWPAKAERITLPLLLMMGDKDRVADVATARDFFTRCASPDKTMHILPGRLHELLRERDRESTIQMIGDWLEAALVKEGLLGVDC